MTPPLASVVLGELRALRRHSAGVTVRTLTLAPTICRLLGAGDPYLTYTRLQHVLLDATADRPLRAAAASLGFAATGDTLLKRLDEAGDGLRLDQRQVRRLSDQGLGALASLIASNWTVEAVPELTVTVTAGLEQFLVTVATVRAHVVEMSSPEFEVFVGDRRETQKFEWLLTEEAEFERAIGHAPLILTRSGVETSVVIVWRGELWPKFVVHWRGSLFDVTSETLGNKLMLRLARSLEA